MSSLENRIYLTFQLFFFCVFRLWFVKWDMFMNPCPTTKRGGRGLGAIGRKQKHLYSIPRGFLNSVPQQMDQTAFLIG